MVEPERFQHYEVQRKPDGTFHELGRGAMGVTYKAFDTNLRIDVALKVINPAFLDSDVVRQRFLREARAAAALRHANVASVFHLGNDGDNWFYAMEFVDGETVDARLRREGPLPVRTALEIALQVTRALTAADKQKLVHRDLKPANIMLEKEDDGGVAVKVIDFGLAKATGKESAGDMTLTQGGFLGTPHFASPEQLEEKEVDIRSDIYSLGVTLWCMLTGKAPFSGSMAQVMSKHLYKPVPVEQLAGLPAAVVDLLKHMLEKQPENRPQIAELRREIEAVLLALPAGVSALTQDPGPTPADQDPMATIMDEPGSTPAVLGHQSAQGLSTALNSVLPMPGAMDKNAPNVTLANKPAIEQPARNGADATMSIQAPTDQSTSRSIAINVGVGRPTGCAANMAISLTLVVAFGAAALFLFNQNPNMLDTSENILVKSPNTTPSPTSAPVTPAVSPSPSHSVSKSPPIPVPTPPPNPLAEGLAEAQRLAQSDNTPAAMTALLALARRFPEEQEPRRRLETICARFIRDEKPADREGFERIQVPLEDAAALGIISATVLLAENLRATDAVRALDLYEKAAAAGDVIAMRQGGLLYSNRKEPGDMARAISWFERGAKLGDAASAYLAGESYLLGKGVARDTAKGLDYLNQAASKDYPAALDRLGDYHYRETKDYAQALSHFDRARRLDWAPSFGNLGVLYVNGSGVTSDPVAAVALFRQGAEKGDPSSMFYYAQCLEGGVGVDSDSTEARKWYEQAAAKGDPRATDKLRKLPK